MKKIFISRELVFIDYEIYQSFHGLTGINRIQQYTLVSRHRRKGCEYTDRRGATDGRDVTGIYRDITLRRSLLETEMPAMAAGRSKACSPAWGRSCVLDQSGQSEDIRRRQ